MVLIKMILKKLFLENKLDELIHDTYKKWNYWILRYKILKYKIFFNIRCLKNILNIINKMKQKIIFN